MTSSRAAAVFAANLALERLSSAWAAASGAAAAARKSRLNVLGSGVGEQVFWRALAAKAMDLLDPALARRAYRALGDPGMALSLESLELAGEDSGVISGSF